MSVLDTERRSTTRSVLRHRPIATDQTGPEPVVTRQRRSRPDTTSVTSLPVAPDECDREEERHPSRRNRVNQPVAPRKAPSIGRPRRHFHPLFFVGIGLLATILLWIGITQLIAWGTNTYNTIVYGYPRTFQTDAVVGQGDSVQHPSHFVAINLHGIVTIVEFPGGDPSRAREFVSSGALGPDAEQAVVTLHFVDLNHNGKPDMLITIGGVQSVLLNDGSTFRVPTPTEQQQILQQLQQS